MKRPGLKLSLDELRGANTVSKLTPHKKPINQNLGRKEGNTKVSFSSISLSAKSEDRWSRLGVILGLWEGLPNPGEENSE